MSKEIENLKFGDRVNVVKQFNKMHEHQKAVWLEDNVDYKNAIFLGYRFIRDMSYDVSFEDLKRIDKVHKAYYISISDKKKPIYVPLNGLESV